MFSSVLCILSLGLVTEQPVLAQDEGLLDRWLKTNPDRALAITLARIEGTPLSLDEALRLALENATGARVAKAVYRGAQATVRREKGAFDPHLFAEARRTDEDRRTATPFSGAPVLETQTTFTSTGARMRLPYGTELEATIETTRLGTNSSFAALEPEYDTTGQLRITQPLLKGFGPAAREELAVAKQDQETARAEYDDALLDVRSRVETTYWDLYAAERNYAVQQLVRDQAQALLSEVRVRSEAGLVGPNQVANAQVFLAEQELAVLDRVEQLDALSDELASFLGRRPAPGESRFRPTDEPPHDFRIAPPDSVVALALRGSRELEAAASRVESMRARVRAARWNALPDLDFVGSVGGNGLSGTPRDVVFGADTLRTDVEGGFGESWSQVFKGDFPTWSAGLVLSVPIGTRSDRAERERLRSEVTRAEEQQTATQRSLEEQVRRTHRKLGNAARRVEVARDGVDASHEQVRIGLLEYQSGRTTAFELVRLGTDLASAQQRFSQALVGAAKAAAELRRLTAGAFPESPVGNRAP